MCAHCPLPATLRCPSRSPGTHQVALQASAKLAELDATCKQQGEELSRAARQVAKLQTRVRLNGSDVRRPLSQVKATLSIV